uniref:Rap-GAP domain-containing protein n=1 Tax=Gasterosteus aculeatus aculeatus TaxID=481459 RepID=A0AAQ4Q2Z7_GASAC
VREVDRASATKRTWAPVKILSSLLQRNERGTTGASPKPTSATLNEPLQTAGYSPRLSSFTLKHSLGCSLLSWTAVEIRYCWAGVVFSLNMQSDDLFIRKFRRQNMRPPIATVSFDPNREASLVEWPPRREADGAEDDSLTPSRVGLPLRSVGRGHIMQRSNSDVTLGDLDSSGKAGGNGDGGVLLHREYGSLSSLERQTQAQVANAENQGPLSPNALRFKDPFLLLGLQGNPPEPDGFFRGLSLPAGDSPKPAKPPKPEGLSKKTKPPHIPQPGPYDNIGGGAWVRNFAHYDVQSILFDLTEAATNRDSIGRKKNITSGASAASQLRPPSQATPSSPAQGGGGNGVNADDPEQSLLLDEGDGNDNELLLSCPHFRNETGGEEQVGLDQAQERRGLSSSLRTPNDAVSVLEEPRESHVQQQGKSNYFIEHADLGAHYYRKYFYMKEHQNFFGMDDRLGPVAISFRRDEKEGSSGAQYNYRIIFRTTEMKTLRGSILEESVPSAARHTTPRGLSPKRLLEFIMPELNLHCLRLASNSPKVRDTLLKLDEQGLNFQRKVGVMYCRAGQSSEEDMYNNESSGPAFEQFLDLLGERVRLKGWEKYRAQLDNKTDSTGTHSLYTRYQDYEIMFHVSTMLPYTSNNTQQLLRKRHIGNDIVTIVFQEPGALPFTPKSIRSHFQHVFIIIQVHEPCTENTYYRVAVTRSKDMPLFGPLFPKGARFPSSLAFRDFLLAKAVNAENAAEKSEKFRSMATRTRQEYLKDLAENYVTTTPIDSSTKFPLLSLGGKRKDKLKGAKGAELHSAGALVWAVMVNSGEEGEAVELRLPCLLGVSAESVVLIERCTRRVVFNCSCRDVIGWKAVAETKEGGPCLDIFYERGESVSISVTESQAEDIREVVQRLELVTRGCEALEVTPLRDGVGQPGFLMNEEGFVTELQRFCYAESGGLQLWARVVRLCGHSLVHLSPEERTRLLRTAHKIHITVIPPDENGKPRRWVKEEEEEEERVASMKRTRWKSRWRSRAAEDSRAMKGKVRKAPARSSLRPAYRCYGPRLCRTNRPLRAPSAATRSSPAAAPWRGSRPTGMRVMGEGHWRSCHYWAHTTAFVLLCADVFQEKEDKAVLQAEVQSLRQNNQRLQEESQSTVARLIKVTELLCNVNKPC